MTKLSDLVRLGATSASSMIFTQSCKRELEVSLSLGACERAQVMEPIWGVGGG